MTNILLVVALLAVFITALVSPHAAGKIERKIDSKASWLKRMSDWLWNPLTWWARTSIDISRKTIKVVTQWGKTVHYKVNHHLPKK